MGGCTWGTLFWWFHGVSREESPSQARHLQPGEALLDIVTTSPLSLHPLNPGSSDPNRVDEYSERKSVRKSPGFRAKRVQSNPGSTM